MIKSILMCVIAVCVSAITCTTWASDIKIGYVDIQRAIQSTSEGKLAKSQLESEFNKKKKSLEEMEKDLKAMNDDYEKKKDVLSEEVKRDKQMNLQKEMVKYRELVGKSQLEIQTKERELTKPIIDEVQKAIAEIAEKEKYTMILEKAEQSVLWAKKEFDLTDEVVKTVEERKKVKKK